MGQDRRFRVALEREHPGTQDRKPVVPVRPVVARPAREVGVSGKRQEGRRQESSLLRLPVLSPQEQLLIGMQDGLASTGRLMLEGVTDPKVAATSMVMAGIALLEMVESRETVGGWLQGVADRYDGETDA